MDNGGGNVVHLYFNALIWIADCLRRAKDPDDFFGMDEVQRLFEGGDAIKICYADRIIKLAEGLRKGYVRIEVPYGSGLDE